MGSCVAVARGNIFSGAARTRFLQSECDEGLLMLVEDLLVRVTRHARVRCRGSMAGSRNTLSADDGVRAWADLRNCLSRSRSDRSESVRHFWLWSSFCRTPDRTGCPSSGQLSELCDVSRMHCIPTFRYIRTEEKRERFGRLAGWTLKC